MTMWNDVQRKGLIYKGPRNRHHAQLHESENAQSYWSKLCKWKGDTLCNAFRAGLFHIV